MSANAGSDVAVHVCLACARTFKNDAGASLHCTRHCTAMTPHPGYAEMGQKQRSDLARKLAGDKRTANEAFDRRRELQKTARLRILAAEVGRSRQFRPFETAFLKDERTEDSTVDVPPHAHEMYKKCR